MHMKKWGAKKAARPTKHQKTGGKYDLFCDIDWILSTKFGEREAPQ